MEFNLKQKEKRKRKKIKPPRRGHTNSDKEKNTQKK
jgi:hypothetical protein